MFIQVENPTIQKLNALEYRVTIVEAVVEYRDSGLAGWLQHTINPDKQILLLLGKAG
jgi:hypothetical protein